MERVAAHTYAPKSVRHRVLGLVLISFTSIAFALVAPYLLRAATGRLPELRFLWRWHQDYPTTVAQASQAPNGSMANGPTARAFPATLAAAAERRAADSTRYEGAYVPIAFPGGDVPADTGVCTDLVVRALRDVGVDLQERVHADMSADFGAYPPLWGLEAPDPSIDHRRVPNLMVYLARHGRALPISEDAADYRPGEIVTWHLGLGMTHIGIVSERRDPSSGRPLIAHHVGGHPSVDDVLFEWRIVGRFALDE